MLGTGGIEMSIKSDITKALEKINEEQRMIVERYESGGETIDINNALVATADLGNGTFLSFGVSLFPPFVVCIDLDFPFVGCKVSRTYDIKSRTAKDIIAECAECAVDYYKKCGEKFATQWLNGYR